MRVHARLFLDFEHLSQQNMSCISPVLEIKMITNMQQSLRSCDKNSLSITVNHFSFFSGSVLLRLAIIPATLALNKLQKRKIFVLSTMKRSSNLTAIKNKKGGVTTGNSYVWMTETITNYISYFLLYYFYFNTTDQIIRPINFVFYLQIW